MLVLRQLHREGWTLPGGLLDHGESPAEGVVREAGEELGLTVDIDPEADLPIATLVEPHSQRVDVIFHRRVDAATERPAARRGVPGRLAADRRPGPRRRGRRSRATCSDSLRRALQQ